MRPTEEFWNQLGTAAIIFAICLGVGCCMFLGNRP